MYSAVQGLVKYNDLFPIYAEFISHRDTLCITSGFNRRHANKYEKEPRRVLSSRYISLSTHSGVVVMFAIYNLRLKPEVMHRKLLTEFFSKTRCEQEIHSKENEQPTLLFLYYRASGPAGR